MSRPSEPTGASLHLTPEHLTGLAATSLTSAQQLWDAWSAALGSLQVPSSAAGDSFGGPRLVSAHVRLGEAAGLAVGHLSSALERDMDAPYAVAFDLTGLDESVAAGLETLTPGEPAPPVPGPAPTPTPLPSPTP